MSAENSQRLGGSCDILRNGQVMVLRTLLWWQRAGDNMQPMRSGKRQRNSGAGGTGDSRESGGE